MSVGSKIEQWDLLAKDLRELEKEEIFIFMIGNRKYQVKFLEEVTEDKES